MYEFILYVRRMSKVSSYGTEESENARKNSQIGECGEGVKFIFLVHNLLLSTTDSLSRLNKVSWSMREANMANMTHT